MCCGEEVGGIFRRQNGLGGNHSKKRGVAQLLVLARWGVAQCSGLAIAEPVGVFPPLISRDTLGDPGWVGVS